MRLAHLSLTDFRNYRRLELALPPGPTVLYGPNAQGKTNILEAIYYLATSRSPHADSDQQLINWDVSDSDEPLVAGRAVARVETVVGARQIELRLIREQRRDGTSFRREALIDRRKVRLMDLLGQLRVVLFLPEDVRLITGSPTQRRRYVDITLCQVDRAYCRDLSAYNKVLEQRNATLRRLAEENTGHDVLPIFTEKLVRLGGAIFARRARFMAELARMTQRIHYESLTAGREALRLHYLPRLMPFSRRAIENGAVGDLIELAEWLAAQADAPEAIVERFTAALDAAVERDIARMSTSIGPHRDDWRFWINGRELASYGSRGQQRSAILALKMGEIAWMEAQTGETPVLLLDEVLSELDEQRRTALLACVQASQQSLLTATSLAPLSEPFRKVATMMRVDDGRVLRDESAPHA